MEVVWEKSMGRSRKTWRECVKDNNNNNNLHPIYPHPIKPE